MNTLNTALFVRAGMPATLQQSQEYPPVIDRTQLYMDVLCTAAEGGVTDWLECGEIVRKNGEYLALKKCHDCEDARTKFADITLDTIALGFERLLNLSVKINRDLLDQVAAAWVSNEGGCDAEAADCVVQAGLFGEVVYG